MVLVAQVDVDLGDAHRPGGDQHAFEEAVRIALEVVAVLEGAGLALVDVHRHQPRRRLGAHDAPLAPGRKAGAAEAAQAGVLHRLDDRLDVARAGVALAQQRGSRPARGRPSKSSAVGHVRRRAVLRDQRLHRLRRRPAAPACWCTTATGACSQRPTQGAAITRTSAPSSAGSLRQQLPARRPSRRTGRRRRARSARRGGDRPRASSCTTSKW